jgi:hypothetical protein
LFSAATRRRRDDAIHVGQLDQPADRRLGREDEPQLAAAMTQPGGQLEEHRNAGAVEVVGVAHHAGPARVAAAEIGATVLHAALSGTASGAA